ncbi:PREDICTED: uncharacterized protein LOC106747226 [Dinoponera quadriceps]|uniref:Uncharacterized protein LOC106747226 n=1 Tax=Dinoponera quadriceps TaxID=609295 RepID=A0A6P3XPX4_DINQU|nr:PREDICTED: uncharacterized protein LOC106747226 [Dinoponera quadriceps]
MGAATLTQPSGPIGYGRRIRIRLEKPADARTPIGKSRCHEDYIPCITTVYDDTAKCNVDVGLELKRNMDNCLRLIVYRGNTIFDNVVVESECEHERTGRNSQREIGTSARDEEDTCNKCTANATRLCTRGLSSYLVSAYIVTLLDSHVYRNSALKALFRWLHDRKYVQIVFIRLRTPRRQFLDYKWNDKLMQMVLERQEADHAMSWLSTLGGAFSALGEEFEHCAEMAGKISTRQFELALRLGNPLLVARCKLYSALSLIQRGHFRAPQCTIKRIHKFALKEKDERLQNMCHGIWAKLQYCYKQYKQQKKLLSSGASRISSIV